MKKILFFCFLLITVLSGCITPTPEAPTQAPLMGTLSFAGSTTVQPLAARLGEAFKQQHSQVSFDIAAGGSSVGIQAIKNGSVDIGMVSRHLSQEESIGLSIYPIAWDVIAVVVHADNMVETLSLEQLRGIYMGEIVNWKEIGGSDQIIIPITREQTSGTRTAFDELALEKKEPAAANIQSAVTAGDMAALVAKNPAAIGYVGFGNLEKNLKVIKINAVAPTQSSARDGTYSLVRPLSLLTGSLSQPLAQKYIEFVLSDKGQKIIETSGWIPVK
ncbi:MAG TPA: phosphate ABC transporter substrate-binding protein [Anaerolineaceae bacterium]|nr:phosphate ABC transporter substrate-binding protein [Anaerolineaceae bacterium]HPN54128.1 phosphate ABC transporter substrate-binding protein [Anaerolineaceae bacterium]